jgi:hypothetical protein
MAILFASFSASGALLSQTLGDQDFTDGQLVGSGTFTAASGGDPAPFNTVIGSDAASNFSTSWTFNGYGGPIATAISSASILIGLWEGDSSAAGDQVVSFTLNGTTNLTGLLNTAMNAKGGLTGHEDWYTVDLPTSAFTELATGSATFSLALQNGLGVLGPAPFNGAGLDFSTLSINTATPGRVPEPATLSLVLLGVIGGGLASRRVVKRG